MKSVIQAIPIYAMSLSLVPRKIYKRIASSLSKFWWDPMQKDTRILWRKWKLLGEHKFLGGLGFRDLEAFNNVLLAKKMWRLIQSPYSLAG